MSGNVFASIQESKQCIHIGIKAKEQQGGKSGGGIIFGNQGTATNINVFGNNKTTTPGASNDPNQQPK